MGNDLMDDKEYKEKEPVDITNDYFRYCIISRKNEERTMDDVYLSPDLNSSENSNKKDDFHLFGIFDGHNSDYVAKYMSNNIQKLYQNEIGKMNNDNYKAKIEDIFKTIDKNLKEEEDKKEYSIIKEKEKEKQLDKEDLENANVINEKKEDNETTEKENVKKHYINVGVDEKEINLFKDIIKNSKDIPDDLKQVEDSQIKDLLLFKNLFKYNNNYLYNDNDVDYIGSSASIVLIHNDNIITADLGITTCILFNKNGDIKNLRDTKNTKDLHELKEAHTFNNKEEKRRVKKFNKSIDYNNLKLNIYVPASRCFGLYKYKKDEILKPENQIISCVPDVNIYKRNDIDYILLMTKGMINLIGDDLKVLIEKIVNSIKDMTPGNNDIKISKIIEEYIKQKEIDDEKNNKNKSNESNSTNKININNKKNSSIYVGKDDFSEENVIINELENNYYKDIMNMNKNNDPSFNSGKLNTTCILIQLFKYKKIDEKKNEIKENNDVNNDKKIEKNEKVEVNKEEIKKSPEKEEVKKEENNNSEIKKEVENNNQEKSNNEDTDKNKQEIIIKKEEDKNKSEEENKEKKEESDSSKIVEEDKKEKDKTEENKTEENKKDENETEENKKDENEAKENKNEESKKEENKNDVKEDNIKKEEEKVTKEEKNDIEKNNKKENENKEVSDKANNDNTQEPSPKTE